LLQRERKTEPHIVVRVIITVGYIGPVDPLVVEGPQCELVTEHIVSCSLNTENLLSGGDLTSRDILQFPDDGLVVPVGEIHAYVQVAVDLGGIDDQLHRIEPVPGSEDIFIAPDLVHLRVRHVHTNCT
jgi:hypothetical protein